MSKSRKVQDFNYAESVLEEWARWMLADDGFPKESPTAKLGHIHKTSKVGAILPVGVKTHCKDVDRAIFVFKKMIESSDKGANRVHILRTINLGRSEGESLEEAIKRLNVRTHIKTYQRALEDFASRLEMIGF